MRKYLKKLSNSIHDDNDLFTELMLSWIAIMLTGLVVLMFIGMLYSW